MLNPNRVFLLLLLLAPTLINPASAKTLTLRITNPENGQPIPGAKVEVYIDDQTTEEVSGSDGSVVIGLPEEGPKYGIRATASAEGFLPTMVSWKRRELNTLPDEYTLALKRGAAIGGKIQDESGKPIQHVKVIISIMPQAGEKERTVVTGHVEWTEDNGEWRCSIAPEKIESVRLRLEHPYFIASEYFDYGQGERRPVGPLRTFEDVIVLKKSYTLEGAVLDGRGRSVKGAKVSMPGTSWDKGRKPAAITDDSGRFRFTELEAGDVTLTAQAEGFAPERQTATVSALSAPIKFRLSKAATIRGRVVDQAGAPIPQVNVSARDNRVANDPGWQGFTDGDGRFEWTSAPHSTLQFYFYKQGFQRINKDLSPQKEEQTITLGSPLIVSGTVEDAETGKAVPRFRVIRGIGWDQPGSQISWERQNEQTGLDGKFSISFEQSYPKHAIRIEAEGYEPSVSQTFTDEEGVQSLIFKLRKGQTLEGLVIDIEGKPVPGAEVLVYTPSGETYVHNGRSQRGQGPVVTSDSEGKFKVDPQIESFGLVVLHDSGVGKVTEAEFTAGLKIPLQPWGRVEGVVRIGANPAPNQQISLNRIDAYEENTPRIQFGYNTNCDKEGRFTFDRVIPGEASISRMIPLGDGRMTTGAGTQNVEIKPGQTLHVQIGGQGRTVVGKVVFPATAEQKISFGSGYNSLRLEPPMPAAIKKMVDESSLENRKRIDEWRKSEEGRAYQRQVRIYQFEVNADGAFHVDEVESGSYTLNIRVQRPDPANQYAQGEPVGTVTHRFRVPEMPGGRSDEPLNLGELPLTIMTTLKAGDPMPPLRILNGESEAVRASDYLGKVLALSFWSIPPKDSPHPDPSALFLKSLLEIPSATDDLVILHVRIGPAPDDSPLTSQGSPRVIECSMEMKELQRFFNQYRCPDCMPLLLLDRKGKILGGGQQPDEVRKAVEDALDKH